ncbi:hypothetical protein [Piscirickettsia litoralis]|uniref:Uncharacterized protein n=1 Tax=Piscirickettsia litoralis TaxID=1891921 RepID=A0ABX3A895_9GAMM|nr:hypothetical protein [Piscirickettsia litoralis]ODN42344.1 hypothetical protein BGC07_04605 [Piscirickettsia litoralis]
MKYFFIIIFLSISIISLSSWSQEAIDAINPALIQQQLSQEHQKASVSYSHNVTENKFNIPESYKKVKFFFPGLVIEGKTILNIKK